MTSAFCSSEVIQRIPVTTTSAPDLIHYILDAYDFGEDAVADSSVLDSHIDDLHCRETERAMKLPNPLLVGESDQSKIAAE